MNKLNLIVSLVVLVVAVGWVELRRPDPVPPQAPERAAPISTDRPGPVALELPGEDPRWPEVMGRLDEFDRRIRFLEQRGGLAAGTPDPVDAGAGGSNVSEPTRRIRDFLAALQSGNADAGDVGELWNDLVASDFPEEAIAAFREHLKTRPNDADANYALGLALTAKLTGGALSPQDQGMLSMEAIGPFKKALKIDDQHFGARFAMAYSYTYWPEQAGVGPESIKHFEILRDRHRGDTSIGEMEEVYICLGNEYRKAGNFKMAAEVYRDGLRDFPDSERIRGQIQTMEK